MSKRVAITGSGLLSPAGQTAAEFHRCLCRGVPVYSRQPDATGILRSSFHSRLDESATLKHLGSRNTRPLDRISRLVTAAAQLALDDSGWTAAMRSAHDVGLVLGAMYCSARTIGEFDRRALQNGPGYTSPMDFANTVMNAAAGQAALWHNLRNLNVTIVAGAASGLQAIAYAADSIRCGRASALLAGGAEDLSPEAAFAFERAGLVADGAADKDPCAVPFDQARTGFAPGESAALLMLEDLEEARRRGAKIIGEIAGYASAWDRFNASDPERSVRVARRCMENALTASGIDAFHIGCVLSSASGSRYGDAQEARALAAALNGTASSTPISATKSVIGETVAASGPLQVITALEIFRTAELPGIAGLRTIGGDIPLNNLCSCSRRVAVNSALVNAFSFDGMLCSMVVRSN